ncbi:MAG: GDSL-type esterase/lipase family protein, partial [Candidatus Methanoperedens sp.]|nr:GDSL-type esterase/lipase family protein [Candidatus Methanoperedens sp.]
MGGGLDGEFIQAGHNDRIRQNGTIYKIRFALAKALNLKQFYFTIWRKNGSNYDKIATTDNLIIRNYIYDGENILDLDPPIEGVQEGDFYGYRIKASDDALYVNKNVMDHLTYYIDSGAALTTNFDWTNQTNASYVFVIEPYMERPYMVFIGDSIISGNPAHNSFIQNLDITNISTSIENQWAKKVHKTYQNMGIGGHKTYELNDRFDSDVISLNPDFVLIEGGINDVNRGINYSEILTNWESMIQKAYYYNITPVIMLILPDSRKYKLRPDKQDRQDTSQSCISCLSCKSCQNEL